MAKVTLPAGRDFFAFNDHIGNFGNAFSFDDATGDYEPVDPTIDQATLDAALITYAADVAGINAAWADKLTDFNDDVMKTEFDSNAGLTAVIKEMVDELNAIRQNAGLPDLNFGVVNAAIRQRINKP
jgi:hypothetical protein